MATQSEDATPRVARDKDVDSEGEDETAGDYPNFPSTAPGLPALDPFSLPSNPDEVPAYLSSLSSSHKLTGSALPKRGLKDFEPHQTKVQASALETSRQSMYNALTHMRTHQPKTRVVGVYDVNTGITRVRQRKGNWLSNVGRDVAVGGVELRREEALWALERGSLDCRFKSDFQDQSQKSYTDSTAGHSCPEDEAGETHLSSEHTDEGHCLPVSLQAAYAMFLDSNKDAPGGSLTMEEYVVYAALKRSGFIVLRASNTERWNSRRNVDARTAHINFLEWIHSLLFTTSRGTEAEKIRLRQGPVVRPGLYRGYKDIFRIIAAGNATPNVLEAVDEPSPKELRQDRYSSTWHVYKANQSKPFKKRDPGPADFSICVVNARTTRLPTLAEMEALLNEQALDQPKKNNEKERNKTTIGQTYGALKHGHRSVLLAIVDEGIVSYLRVADAMFVVEGRLYERDGFGEPSRRGGKKGGGGRGRNRGQRR